MPRRTLSARLRSRRGVERATLADDPAELVSWIRESGFDASLRCVYESGPAGFGLARALQAAGIPCTVAAVSKLPRHSGGQKNDRRDAEWLARMLAADLRRAKQRVSSFLLLTKTPYSLTKKRWTKTFYKWAESCPFARPAFIFFFKTIIMAVPRLEERLAEVEAEMLRTIAARPELSEWMARFECIHGIGKVAALVSFLGLVPSESSSGERSFRGRIAKTGNSHLRRILVEAAGCCSRGFKAVRSEGLCVPEAVRAKAEKCANRLKGRREALRARGVNANKAKVAVARELCEWIYLIAVVPA